MSLRRTFSLSAVPHGVRRTAARRLLASALLCPTLGMLDACAPGMSQYASRSAAADSSVRAAIARERSIQNTEIAANAVGVLPLTVTTSDSTYASLGYGVAALLASDLARSSKLVVVERLRLDAVIRELDLAKSGRVDSTSAPSSWARWRFVPTARCKSARRSPTPPVAPSQRRCLARR